MSNLFLVILVFMFYPSTTSAQINPPTLVSGATQVSVLPVNRIGANTTVISATFTDIDGSPASAFTCTFKIREPNNITELTLVNALTHGGGGLTVVLNGNGTYTASYIYNPLDVQNLGFYDLYFEVTDGSTPAVDDYATNLDELEIITNNALVVQSDATIATPAGIERIGANITTITARFTDLDIPLVSTFQVTFKLRYNDLSEIILADNVGHGTSGVTITDLTGGLYEASISWDPPDAQSLGYYDLYFHVTDGIDISYDQFSSNLDELQVYDAISNKPPGISADTTLAIPISVNRIGSEFTMLKSVFWDGDYPGSGSFVVTFKVRDPALTESIIVNVAKHGEQGLRIVHLGDSLYEAAVLWDPPVSAATGLYDIYFEVTDNNGASVIDDYTTNSGELTVISSAPLGDGNLLHRANDASGCGGPTSACHNIKDHQSQDCRVCHTPHSTTNIYLIEDTIQTPNSGPREVIFKTLGIGDPHNNPDPIVGDPTSGVMADDADGVNTGVCEVCHTTVNHHRNDDSHSGQAHHNAEDCTGCHGHANGFSGGESGGGVACTCHENILTTMDTTSLLTRHILANSDANYTPGASGMYTIKNCLSCHVDHDIFRPDLNVGFGTRGSNLRTDWAIDPVAGDATVLLNSDYQSTGNGGVCLSCHSGPSCDGCHSAHKAPRPTGAAAEPNVHRFVPKADYDAATSGHNYSVPITFAADGSIFNANCTKCHNDDMAKAYQNSSVTISLHGSTFSRILDTTGISAPADPLEERFCFKCHSTTSNPNAGSNQDFFGVKGIGTNSLGIEAAFGQTYTHPISSTSGIHTPIEDPATMTRHVECEDCHNPHAAATGGTGLPNSLKDVTGVDVFGNPVSSVTASRQICFKCHADNPGSTSQINRQFNNNRNTRQEFDTASASYHPVVGMGKNNNSPSLINGWTESSVMTCEDCHAPSTGTVNGPHGSGINKILKLRYDTGDNLSESSARYALCYSCHDRNSILGDQSFGEHDKHIRGANAPCSICHDAHGSTGQPHLINFDTNICTPVSSRLEFIDDDPGGTNPRGTCWVRCHGKNHDGFNY